MIGLHVRDISQANSSDPSVFNNVL